MKFLEQKYSRGIGYLIINIPKSFKSFTALQMLISYFY